MMPNRLSHHTYTKNIWRDAKIMHNILKCYMYIENTICEYFNLLSLYEGISKSFGIYSMFGGAYGDTRMPNWLH